jgi:hypothetical protein
MILITGATGNVGGEVLKQAAAARKAMLDAGLPEWSADALLDLQRLYREGKASQVESGVEQLTGRKARTFEQFARDHVAAWQAS